jgi:AcrR family transcriptional regulator
VGERNPDAKRQSLLDAALKEFAEHGISAARTDAIAERAGCSSGLIYTYFGSKSGLFDAVYDRLIADVVSSVPFAPDDLPGYAGKMFDFHVAHPDISRVIAWHQLERDSAGGMSAISAAVGQRLIDATEAAQRSGTASTAFDAAQLVYVVEALALSWAFLPREITDRTADRADLTRRRATVVSAVEKLFGNSGQ